MKGKTYLIKNIPLDLWAEAQAYKNKTGIPLKRLILDGLRERIKPKDVIVRIVPCGIDVNIDRDIDKGKK